MYAASGAGRIPHLNLCLVVEDYTLEFILKMTLCKRAVFGDAALGSETPGFITQKASEEFLILEDFTLGSVLAARTARLVVLAPPCRARIRFRSIAQLTGQW